MHYVDQWRSIGMGLGAIKLRQGGGGCQQRGVIGIFAGATRHYNSIFGENYL